MAQRTARGSTGRARAASCLLAAAGMALLSGCGEGGNPAALTAPTPPAVPAEALAGSRVALIQFEEITIPRDQPGTIDPCWFVNRAVYAIDRRIDRFDAEFTFTYLSRGTRTTRRFTIDVREGDQEPPEPEVPPNFIELKNHFDLGDAIIDPGSPVDATVRLLLTVGRRTVVLDEAHMAVTN